MSGCSIGILIPSLFLNVNVVSVSVRIIACTSIFVIQFLVLLLFYRQITVSPSNCFAGTSGNFTFRTFNLVVFTLFFSLIKGSKGLQVVDETGICVELLPVLLLLLRLQMRILFRSYRSQAKRILSQRMCIRTVSSSPRKSYAHWSNSNRMAIRTIKSSISRTTTAR